MPQGARTLLLGDNLNALRLGRDGVSGSARGRLLLLEDNLLPILFCGRERVSGSVAQTTSTVGAYPEAALCVRVGRE